MLTKIGYQVIRQKGSHVRLKKITDLGEHPITVCLHDPVAKGTLNDLLSKERLIEILSK